MSLTFVLAVLCLAAASSGEMCPTKTHPTCASGMTCCLLPSGGEGCCPYVNATCCSDRVHCCPMGSTCVEEGGGHCRTEHVKLASFFPAANIKRENKMKLLTPSAPLMNVTTENCDDGSQCPDDATCCPLGGGAYGCCPLPEAVCCADKQHCCPKGSLCDPAGYCKQDVSGKNTDGDKWRLATKKVATVCPGGQQQCPTISTCCAVGPSSYGCCPLPNADCCRDMKSCCPQGYRCVGDQQCTKKKHVFLP